MIYFVRNADGQGAIKIGTSIKLSVRIRELCGEYKCDLRVIAVISGRRREEAELHRRFAHLRTGNHHSSEWFHPRAELLDFIEKEGFAWDGLDEVPAPPARLMVLPLDVVKLARIAATYR